MPYTKIPKPGAQSYTNLSKPTDGSFIRAGMATGLLISLTYAKERHVNSGYTGVPKPGAQSYINIPKPI